MACLKLALILTLFWTTSALSFTNSGEEINETIICAKDLIEVEIPKHFFIMKSPPVYIWNLHLNDPECQGFENEDSYVFRVKTNLSDCGTIMASDGVHIVFINTIQNNNTDIITRTYINITFACRYPINYMVQQPNGENMISVDVRSITLNTEDGNFSITMMLFKDENYEEKWTTIPFLTLEDNIYVKVNMVPAHLIMRLERCWATPTNEPHHNTQYNFIRDSCPEVTNEQIFLVIKNGHAAEATFRIQMFKFVGESYRDVFLHCNVRICHNTATVCQPNCTSSGGVARTRRDVVPLHTVSYGPISRKPKETKSAGAGTGHPPAIDTFILVGLLLAVLIITGIFGKLWLQTRRAHPTVQAQLTLANIYHSEVAS
ncbi:pancreatic secretory granule membrane major glycoprotein GP2 [Callorhinchus milii]|uniref:pancreatic secretory granule membrane major glycoprotein GP2 n=1 Tax=Callorhinchus milii TaxID=7868 RepID=UPI00045737BF|nr:pancreatic secretory granule membrane major glycoprotein GP2 [Callorhinchus milii]|eukprot:gi/632953988/ref/XP_007892721.1/ PREDICTED: pancreatic secretory granule membrane major glycoprotein GP2-like [Callorhinchus milii]